jgi:NhaP-type Na+/H+ or K+/H+ antiporter
LFGEGIVNDAVAIVIFRSISKYLLEADKGISFNISFKILAYFGYLLIASVLVGIIMGLLISFFFK